MKTITKKINIYNFDELEKDTQKKLIEKEIEEQQEFYCQEFLESEMEEEAKNLLKKYFKNKAIFKSVYYDLSYSQGSGAMIEFDLYYYNKPVTIKQHGHYYHERSFLIENDIELTDKQYEQLKWKIIEMNHELTKKGYELIEYRMTEEEAREYLKDFEYLKDGTIF